MWKHTCKYHSKCWVLSTDITKVLPTLTKLTDLGHTTLSTHTHLLLCYWHATARKWYERMIHNRENLPWRCLAAAIVAPTGSRGRKTEKQEGSMQDCCHRDLGHGSSISVRISVADCRRHRRSSRPAQNGAPQATVICPSAKWQQARRCNQKACRWITLH